MAEIAQLEVQKLGHLQTPGFWSIFDQNFSHSRKHRTPNRHWKDAYRFDHAELGVRKLLKNMQ